MSNLDQITKLKKKVASLQSNVDKARGHLEQLRAELQEKFNCDGVESAEKMLDVLKIKAASAEKSFKKELAKFEEKWPEE